MYLWYSLGLLFSPALLLIPGSIKHTEAVNLRIFHASIHPGFYDAITHLFFFKDSIHFNVGSRRVCWPDTYGEQNAENHRFW